MAAFGELLSELRKDKGLSQKELAKIFHLAGSTISSYEIGAHSPNAEQIRAFAEYFDVTADYLLGRTPFNISPNVLWESFVDHIAIHDIVTALQGLSENRRRALGLLISDMQFSAAVQRNAESMASGKPVGK